MSFVSFVLSSEKEQDFVCHGIFIYVWKFGGLEVCLLGFLFFLRSAKTSECLHVFMDSCLLDSMHL